METYKKVFIKTEADCPKEEGIYHVLLINGNGRLLHYPFKGDVGYNVDKFNWMDTVEYYLQPISDTELIVSSGQKMICSDCGHVGNEATHDCHKDFIPKSIFTRKRERSNKTYDFVVSHKTLIYNATHYYGNYTSGQNDPHVQELIVLARKEIGYSDKTWSGDIYMSLINLYRKICV